MKRAARPLRFAACAALSVSASLTLGCAVPHKLISAKHTRCAVRDIEIKEVTYAADQESWVAVCGKRSYDCSTKEQGRRLIYACVKR